LGLVTARQGWAAFNPVWRLAKSRKILLCEPASISILGRGFTAAPRKSGDLTGKRAKSRQNVLALAAHP